MSGDSVLVLVPPEGAVEVSPAAPLLGLPTIRRTVLAARRAGFERVVIAGATPEILGALDGASADTADGVPPGAARLPWNRVVGVRELEELRDGAADVGVPVATDADRPRAERLLLWGLVKDTEGFMSRASTAASPSRSAAASRARG